MHDINDPRNQIDRAVVESSEMLGKECATCAKILAYSFFERDSSYRDGRRPQCLECEGQPRLPLEEHTLRLREKNMRSEALKRQRGKFQDDYRNSEARRGRLMHHSELLLRIQRMASDLYIKDGNIVGDLALYQVFPQAQKRLEGRDYKYLGYMPTGWLPEFSIYQFDKVRDLKVREDQRGWRSVLLRLIKSGVLTEEQCNREFGSACGEAATVWRRTLWEWRNHKTALR